MAYYARPEEILYHTHLSQNMLMGAKLRFCQVTLDVYNHWQRLWDLLWSS